MLEHLHDDETEPERVVILGAGGFVGAAAQRRLEEQGISVLGLSRQDRDLDAYGAADQLAGMLEESDSLVMVSAKAPCKDEKMLAENLRMMEAVTAAIGRVKPAHVIYISSDAVYADDPNPLTEDSLVEPDSHHGQMHIRREGMLREAYGGPLCILRPSLLYGTADPHNGYGPNRFRRLAADGEDIVLFGEGEERRDHILIDDVAEIIRLCLMHRSQGVLNVATGEVSSFRDIAEMVVAHFETPVEIKGSPRSGPMPHGGYRPFDPAATKQAFPGFAYTALMDGLAKVHAETAGGGG